MSLLDVNDPPSGADTTIHVLEDTPYVITASEFGFSDTDSPSDALAGVIISTLPATGGLFIVPSGGDLLNATAVQAGGEVSATDILAGRLIYVPEPDASGPSAASFSFRVRDDGGTLGGSDLDPSPNTITIDIAPVNDAPILDTSVPITLPPVTEDPGAPSGAGVAVSALADLVGGGGVNNVTDADSPAAVGIAVTGVSSRGTLYYSLDGGSNWTSLASASTTAALLLGADAQIYFRPAANFNGTIGDAITFKAWDASSGTSGLIVDASTVDASSPFSADEQTVALVVSSVSDAPVGADNTVALGAAPNYTFAAADFGFADPDDIPSDAFTAVVITSLPTEGALTLNGNPVNAGDSVSVTDIEAGLLVYAPTPGVTGTTAFTFQVLDNGSLVNGGANTDASANTFTFELNSPPTVPVDTDGVSGGLVAENAASGTAVGVTAFSSDVETPEDVTYSLSDDAGGLFAIDQETGEVTVAGALDFETAMSHVITVIATDGSGATSEADFTVTVTNVNEAPTFAALGPDVTVAEQAMADLDTDATVSDPELDAANGGSGDYSGAVLTVSRHGGASEEDQFSIAAAADFQVAGNVISDSSGNAVADFISTGGTLTINFTSQGAPATSALVNAIIQGIGYTNASDAPPATVVLDYTFADGNTGSQGDGEALSAAGQLTVNVTAVNDSPHVANPIADQEVSEDAFWNFDVPPGSFVDVDGDTLIWTATLADNTALPVWLSFDATTQTFSGTPPLNFNGNFELKVTASDGMLSYSDTFTLTVNPVNDAPTGAPSAVLQSGIEDVPYIVSASSLLAGFTDAEDDPMSVLDLTASDDGIVTENGNGTYTITMPANFNGPLTLTYVVDDGQGGSTPASLGVTIDAVNDAPTGNATANLADGRVGRDYTIREADLLAGFSDVDGDALTVENLSASEGTLTDNGDGTWTLRPSLLFNGEVTLTYEVSDGAAPPLAATQSFDIVFNSGGGTGGEEPVSVIEGTPGADSLPGTDGDDVFQPLEGDDDVFGGEGDDSVILPGDADGYVFVALANGKVGVLDIDPSDGDQGSDVLDGIEFVRFGDANGTDTPLGTLIDMEQPAWTLAHDDVALVAATWQLFMGSLPSAGGFEYLIRSDDNPTDLNDPYYAPFNAENTYLNFTTNYATGNPTGRAWFEQEFGDPTYEEAVEKAFDLIITSAALTATGGDPEGSKQFFLDAEGYFEQVAAERIVPGGVDLADAVKIALLSSVLYEAVRADVGPYAEAINDFADEVQRVGTSTEFLGSLLEAA